MHEFKRPLSSETPDLKDGTFKTKREESKNHMALVSDRQSGAKELKKRRGELSHLSVY